MFAGLHETRQPELVDHARPERGEVLTVAELQVRALRESAAANICFIAPLCISDRGAEDARADVRQVGQLEQALHRAVLTEGTVEQREHDVDVEPAPTGARDDRAQRFQLGTFDGERSRQRGGPPASRAAASSAACH